jgi:pimeloyl-ACP methyl ester carboxylesterase
MPLRIDVPHETRTLVSRDGTRIFYVVAGTGSLDFVLCPGLGGPVLSYKYLIEHFGHAFRFISWEPRGLFRSSAPAAGAAALGIPDHVADLEAIVEQERLERFVIGGWSMGVQISLEYYRRQPERCSSLVLISGTAGSVLRTVGGLQRTDRLLVPLARLVSAAGPGVNLAARALLDKPLTVSLLRAAKVVADNPRFFQEVVGEFKNLDFGRYMQMLIRLNEHSAEDCLESVRVPALVAVGSNDLMVPPRLGEEMVRRMPQAELLLIPGGTHYALMEYPHVLNSGVSAFLRRVHPEAMAARRAGAA